MKTLTLRHTFQKAWCLALFAALLLAASGARSQDDQDGLQTHRFLLIFETSTTVKKNLPAIQEILAKLFADNLSNQLRPDDDIAVWTVDTELHDPSEFSASWVPEDAAAYTDSLCNFLAKQKYSRHASIAPIQPALDRIAKSSQHLTVLIFCDTQSHLIGTPYDTGVNEIITNTVAGAKSPFPLILVLRAYRGEFIGSSVNRSERLVYPTFPTPPKPAPPVAHNPVRAPHPLEGPLVTPIPAMIIVGTNAGTNISILTNAPPPPPPPSHSPPSAAKMAPAATATATTAAPAPAPPVATAPPPPPAPAPLPTPAAPPNSAPAPQPQAAVVAPATMAKQPVPVAPAPPVAPQSNAVTAAAVQTPSGNNYFLLLALGIGALTSALVIAVRLIVRSRRPASSLITSSMIEDPRHPPQN